MKILIVEDEEVLRQMYQDAFLDAGFEVVAAGDGKSGIIEAAKEKPDFILLDIMMPQMDGVSAFRHLKELPETALIPVGFLTVVPEGVPESLSHEPDLFKDATGFWRKDQFTPQQIVDEVKKLLGVA